MACLRRHGEDSSKAFAPPALERVDGQHHALAALPPPHPRKTPVPIVHEAGWVLGPVGTGTENLAHAGDRYSLWVVAIPIRLSRPFRHSNMLQHLQGHPSKRLVQ